MVPQEKVDAIRRLLADGLSRRTIVRTMGVSRATLMRIARGDRSDPVLRKAIDPFESLGPVRRCRECGGRVVMPCRLCHVRRLKEAKRRLASIGRRELERDELRAVVCSQRLSRSA